MRGPPLDTGFLRGDTFFIASFMQRLNPSRSARVLDAGYSKCARPSWDNPVTRNLGYCCSQGPTARMMAASRSARSGGTDAQPPARRAAAPKTCANRARTRLFQLEVGALHEVLPLLDVG